MGLNFWLDSWKDNKIPFHQKQINPILKQQINHLNLSKGDIVLVPLCGKSLDMLWLAELGYKVIGVELSEIAVEEFYTESNIIPTIDVYAGYKHYKSESIDIICGDFFNIDLSTIKTINAIYDRAALIALPNKLRESYIKRISEISQKGVKVLLIVIESQEKNIGPPYQIDVNDITKLYSRDFLVDKIYQKNIENISQHIKKLGYKEIKDVVYLLERI